jgi:hypothetical protein
LIACVLFFFVDIGIIPTIAFTQCCRWEILFDTLWQHSGYTEDGACRTSMLHPKVLTSLGIAEGRPCAATAHLPLCEPEDPFAYIDFFC